jgi:hypothetical protein
VGLSIKHRSGRPTAGSSSPACLPDRQSAKWRNRAVVQFYTAAPSTNIVMLISQCWGARPDRTVNSAHTLEGAEQ